jgi:multidrug efflux system outer membrane protein
MRRALLVLLLTGCAGGLPGNVRPGAELTVLPSLTPPGVTEAAVSIDRWWRLMGDARLEQLIEEALARNADLESAAARVREAQATLDVVRAAQSPTLDAQFTNSRRQQSRVGATPLPPGFPRTASSHKLSLEAGYEVDLWGRLAAGSAAARSQLLATEWARAAVEWALTARVAETYFELGAAERRIAITESVRASRKASFELRSRERSAGAGTELDLRRAEAELAATEASLASLGRQRAALERSMLLLLGRNPTELKDIAIPQLDESRPLSLVLPQGAGAELLVRRPDVRQAEAQLAAANSSIEAARAATLPSLRLSGSVGSDARSMNDLFSGPAAIWSLAAGVTQPIIDGGRLKARVREERARAEQSLASYRKVVAGAVAEVREAYVALELNRQAFEADRQRTASLARASALARRGYEAGAAAQLDVLDAERNWHQAQLDQVGAYRDQLIGQIAAYKSLGGGYTRTGSSL